MAKKQCPVKRDHYFVGIKVEDDVASYGYEPSPSRLLCSFQYYFLKILTLVWWTGILGVITLCVSPSFPPSVWICVCSKYTCTVWKIYGQLLSWRTELFVLTVVPKTNNKLTNSSAPLVLIITVLHLYMY